VVERVARAGRRRKARIENVASQGSVDNLQRLAAGADDCDVHFALVQDGVPAPDSDDLELVARLERTEAVLMLAPDAASLVRFDQLAGKRIGIGAAGSGTDHLARRIFEADELAALGVRLENHDVDAALDRVATGALDLAVVVMDEDAAMIRTAVRERGLQLAAFEHLGAIAHRHPFVSLGRIEAGQFDPVAVVPPAPVPVLRVDTLLVGNGCASRSAEMALLSLMSAELPGFVRRNRNPEGGPLPASAVAREFFEDDGPGFADRYIPWLVDLMPLGNWIYVAMTVSVLFNLMSGWHRFRLWRVDANRDRAHQIVRDALGQELTPAEILALEPAEKHRTPALAAQLDAAMRDLDALRVTCRLHQNSILVPMGAEYIYRYEEEQMESILTALRVFRAKLG
jgi:hypothetical protein